MAHKLILITILVVTIPVCVMAKKQADSTLVTQLQQRLTPGEWEYLKSKMGNKSPWDTAATIIPWLTTLFAIVGFFIQQYWQRQRETRTLLYEGLKWFEGDTQKRSIGIALIEASWSTDKQLQKAWRAVLTNQAIYLLGRSKQLDAPHEIGNLERIMEIILSRKLVEKTQIEQLNNMLQEKIDRQGGVPGLDLRSYMAILDKWKKGLNDKNTA